VSRPSRLLPRPPDFRALPKPAGQTATHYLGLAVPLPKGDPLVYLPVDYTPTVNDLADLLADAMCRPLTGSARRPERLVILLSPRPADPGRQFPALAMWVQEGGWVEVGRRKEAGFVARALDDAGVVFENNSTTLGEALAALEEGLAGRFSNQESALLPPSPTVKKAQRRPRGDA
jgi:hypothetical protein